MKLMHLFHLPALLRALGWRCRGTAAWRGKRHAGRTLAAAAAPCNDSERDDADDRPRACGWFDSSHDLQRGLRVHEHSSPEALAREMPLTGWLELQLAACTRAR